MLGVQEFTRIEPSFIAPRGEWEGNAYVFESEEVRREKELRKVAELLELSREYPEYRASTRNKHYIGVRTVATAATLRIQAVNLWNPHASSRIQLWEVWIVNTAATGYNISMARTTARGTATTTATPAAANSILNDTAALSGLVVDTAWSVAPTVGAADLIRWNIPANIGAGVILSFPDPIDVTPVGGMALIAATATIFQPSDVTFVIGD